MPPKEDWEKYKAPLEDDDKKPDDDKIVPLTEGDIQVLKSYGAAPTSLTSCSLHEDH